MMIIQLHAGDPFDPLPNHRYWAVALPTYLCLAFVMIFIFYFGLNMMSVPDKDDMRNLTGMVLEYSTE